MYLCWYSESVYQKETNMQQSSHIPIRWSPFPFVPSVPQIPTICSFLTFPIFVFMSPIIAIFILFWNCSMFIHCTPKSPPLTHFLYPLNCPFICWYIDSYKYYIFYVRSQLYPAHSWTHTSPFYYRFHPFSLIVSLLLPPFSCHYSSYLIQTSYFCALETTCILQSIHHCRMLQKNARLWASTVCTSRSVPPVATRPRPQDQGDSQPCALWHVLAWKLDALRLVLCYQSSPLTSIPSRIYQSSPFTSIPSRIYLYPLHHSVVYSKCLLCHFRSLVFYSLNIWDCDIKYYQSLLVVLAFYCS